jgi:outer membrane protein TolC
MQFNFKGLDTINPNTLNTYNNYSCRRIKGHLIYLLLFWFCALDDVNAQTLSMKDAIDRGTNNFGIIKAKEKYLQAAQETVKQMKREYLPNLNLSAQQTYGTVNGQNGPLYGLGGLGVASSGLPLAEQNWNAAFGALYLVNVNWEFFSFGRARQRVQLAQANALGNQKDYAQEVFQHKVRIGAAYLNLFASQRLLASQLKNLERAEIFRDNVVAKVINGLLPGVDSTTATAEVSRAKITINQIREQVKTQNNELLILLGDEIHDIVTDTLLISRSPATMAAILSASVDVNHPTKDFFRNRINISREQQKLFRKEYYPSFSLFSVYQSRASGFNSDYASNQNSFTSDYFQGITPSRQNYLLGVGLVWNITSIARSSKKVSYQRLVTEGLEEEYKTIEQELDSRDDAANTRLDLAFKNFQEAPVQVNAAQQAYSQRLTLYTNGLADLTDVTTASYILNRAEIDRDIAFTNVWQALLMKAAATGNFEIFTNQL